MFPRKCDNSRKTGLNIDVPRKRRKGFPKQRSLDKVYFDLMIASSHPHEAFGWEIGITTMEIVFCHYRDKRQWK